MHMHMHMHMHMRMHMHAHILWAHTQASMCLLCCALAPVRPPCAPIRATRPTAAVLASM